MAILQLRVFAAVRQCALPPLAGPFFAPVCTLDAFVKKASAMSVQALHGITLESLLTRLVTHYGWDGLARKIDIKCFTNDPSIKSSLKFLRKTPWARERVEALYLETQFNETGAPHDQ